MLLRVVLISCVLTLWILTGQAVVLKSPKGLHYMGVGYNLLEGNPEGGQVSSGGVDPGLLFTRKIFKLTWNTNKVSMDKTTSLPDQVSFAPRQSCVKTNQKEVVTGSKSYQEKLSVDVQASGGYNNLLFGVAFSVSGRFEKMQKETSKYHNVFYEEKHVCNRGRARYQLDLAAVKGYPVSHDFASAVCSLPASYDDKKYYNFIERWGTHIVVEADLGTRTIEQFKSSQAEFTTYAMENVESAVSVSGSYKGYSASLQVDVKKFKESMSDKTKFGENKQVLTSGGDDLPEPIAIKLVPIDVAIQMTFFSSLGNMTAHRAIGCFFTAAMLASKRAAVQRALVEYPKKKGAINPVDPLVRIPLTWPKGTYGLPMPKVGCPKVPGFTWHQGTRLHDTENTFPSNGWSQTYSLAGKISRNDMEQKFCMKTQEMSNKYDLLWPKGQYCIFKKGACPKGLKEGYIRWDDEFVKNHNSYSGTIPDGQYDKNTLIRYCCRTDGYATNEIILPADKPFVLFKSNTHQCQKVRGMRVTGEFFSWDCNDWFPQNKSGGYKPYASIRKNIKIDYCYYTPKAS